MSEAYSFLSISEIPELHPQLAKAWVVNNNMIKTLNRIEASAKMASIQRETDC